MLPSLWLSILENWENMKKNKEEKSHLFYNYATQRKPLLISILLLFHCSLVIHLYTRFGSRILLLFVNDILLNNFIIFPWHMDDWNHSYAWTNLQIRWLSFRFRVHFCISFTKGSDALWQIHVSKNYTYLKKSSFSLLDF